MPAPGSGVETLAPASEEVTTAPQTPESGPRFYEPDDRPSASKPVGEGPFYENDRRDRPFYDTEVEGADYDGTALAGEGGRVRDFGGEEDVLVDPDEGDDEDDPTLAAQPPPEATARELPAAAGEAGSGKQGGVCPDNVCDRRGGQDEASVPPGPRGGT